jgi:hypothetical protein
MTTMATQFEGLRSVSGTVERALLFPAPSAGQKVYNQTTGNIEEWDGAAWQTVITGSRNHRVNFNIRNYGAVGDGATDDTAAFVAALTDAVAAGESTLKIPAGNYRLTGPITVPSLAAGGLAIEGEGGGGPYKSQLTFTGGGGLAFGATGGYLRMARLALVHASASALANGVGLSFTSDPYYLDFDDLWMENFNINIQQAGNAIYSSYRRVRALYGYTACVRWAAALHNGNWFEDCNFSGSVNGIGLDIVDAAGAACVTFRSCKFEGNFSYGIKLVSTGFINAKFDTCYWETNGNEDCYLENGYPNAASLVTFDTCYWDPNNAPLYVQHVRIRAKRTRLVLLSCRFYQMNGAVDPYTVPPVLIDDGTLRAAQPSIAINCEYDTPTIASDETGWVITDSKHPLVAFGGASPVLSAWHGLKAGSLILNSDEASNDKTLGWMVRTAGRGNATHPTATATTTVAPATARYVQLNDAQHFLLSGDLIAIAGVTWDRTAYGYGATDGYARILEVMTGGVLRMDGLALAAVAGAAVTYRTMTVATIPQLRTGTWTPDVQGLTAAGDYSVVAVGAVWQRHGRQVTVHGELTITVNAPGTGSVLVTGLPFTKAANERSVGTAELAGAAFAGADYCVVTHRSTGAVAELVIRRVTTNAATGNVDCADLATGDVLAFSLTYNTDDA